MNRATGEPPRSGDELPERYQARRMTLRSQSIASGEPPSLAGVAVESKYW